MTTSALPGNLEPTQDERTMATLAHALQIIAAWVAPLVIFLIRRESRFVSFHALQALLLQIVNLIAIVIFAVGWFGVIFSTIIFHASSKAPGAAPLAVFGVILLFWLLLVGMSITVMVCAIVYAVKAHNGEWAEYPVLGRLARRLLKMGPRGRSL